MSFGFDIKEAQNAWVLAWQQTRDEFAMKQLIKSCRTLIYMEIKQARRQSSTIPREDLIQAGEAAVARAAETFDPARKTYFGKYAQYWMRENMQQAIRYSDPGAPVKMSDHSAALMREVRRVVEIADKSGRHRERALRIAARVARTDLHFARRCLETTTCVSLNHDADDEKSGLELRDEAPTGADVLQAEQARRILEEVIDTACGINLRAAEIARRRYLGDEIVTYQEIADDMGITRERVRQIDQVAISSMRTEMRKRGLEFSDLVG